MLIKKWAGHWSPFYIHTAWYRLRLFFLCCAINLFPLPHRATLRAQDIHLGLELIALCLVFSNDMGNPSPLPIVRARSCHGCDVGLFGSHFSIYLPRYRDGCRPGSAARCGSPVCSSEHLSRCASAPPIFTRPRRSAISLHNIFPSTLCLSGARRSKTRRNLGDQCSLKDPPPKTAFPDHKSNYNMLTWRKDPLLIFERG